MYMLRNTIAKRTVNVTVPINWYFPSMYSGSSLFSFMETKLEKLFIFVLPPSVNGGA